jgi:hypothetical protein
MISRLVICLLALFFLLQVPSFADGEFTGAGERLQKILQQNRINWSQLRNRGFRLGEVTGAGRSVPLDDVTHLITNNKVFSTSRISHLKYRRNSSGKSISDVEAFEIGGRTHSANVLKGFIYK